MNFGAVLPTCEIGTDPVVLRDFAQTAEDLGYSHIVLYDHVVGAVHENRDPPLWGPYTDNDPFHEPLVLFGYLAGVTTRIELATGVLILPQRQTVLVAKQAAEIDLLSGGRLRLAVGTGWNYVEYDALGVPFSARGRRLEEQVQVLRTLWSEPLVDFEGRFHRIDRAALLPRPERAIPVWFGGGTEASVQRAARIGDGYMFGSSGERAIRLAGRAGELLADQGRDPGQFGLEAMVDFSEGAKEWADKLARWQALGGTHLSIRTMSTAAEFLGVRPSGLGSPAEHIKALEIFINAVR